MIFTHALNGATPKERLALLDGNALIHVYSGPVPETLGALHDSASRLVTITGDNGSGLDFELASNPLTGEEVVQKRAGSKWVGTADTSGNPTFFRLQDRNDAILAQGTVGITSGDLRLAYISAGYEIHIDFFQVIFSERTEK